jgi:hypothetical protein
VKKLLCDHAGFAMLGFDRPIRTSIVRHHFQPISMSRWPPDFDQRLDLGVQEKMRSSHGGQPEAGKKGLGLRLGNGEYRRMGVQSGSHFPYVPFNL